MIIWLKSFAGKIVGQANVPFEWSRLPSKVIWDGHVYDLGSLGGFAFGAGGPPTTYSEVSGPYALKDVVEPDASLVKPRVDLP